MQLVEVDIVGPKAVEAVLQGALHIFGSRPSALRAHGHPEFCCDNHVRSLLAERHADLFATSAAVDICRVEEIDPCVECRPNHFGALPLVCPPAEIVATEAYQRDIKRTDLPYWHEVSHRKRQVLAEGVLAVFPTVTRS